MLVGREKRGNLTLNDKNLSDYGRAPSAYRNDGVVFFDQ